MGSKSNKRNESSSESEAEIVVQVGAPKRIRKPSTFKAVDLPYDPRSKTNIIRTLQEEIIAKHENGEKLSGEDIKLLKSGGIKEWNLLQGFNKNNPRTRGLASELTKVRIKRVKVLKDIGAEIKEQKTPNWSLLVTDRELRGHAKRGSRNVKQTSSCGITQESIAPPPPQTTNRPVLPSGNQSPTPSVHIENPSDAESQTLQDTCRNNSISGREDLGSFASNSVTNASTTIQARQTTLDRINSTYNNRSMSWPKWAQCVSCWSENLDPFIHYGSQKFILLQCCHLICSACMDRLENKPPKDCPKCSRTLKPYAMYPEITPLDYTVLGKMKRICALCIRNEDAVLWCADCDKYLCKLCVDHHPFGVVSSTHTLQEIVEEEAENEEKCEHGEKFEFYCKCCERAVCERCDCAHLNHNVVDLASFLEGELNEFKSVLKDVKLNVLEITEKSKKIDAKLERLMSTEKIKLIEEVNAQKLLHLATLSKIREEKEQQLRKSIERETSKIAARLMLKEAACSNELRSAFQFSHFLRSLMSSASVNKISPMEFSRAMGIVKTHFPSQLELLRKYTGERGKEFFEVDYKLSLDKSGLDLFSKSLTIRKIYHQKTAEKGKEME